MQVLVSGATGFIGRRLTGALAAAGHDVTALVRTRDGRAGRSVLWDELSPGHLDGVGAVVNLAGASIAGGRWTAARKAELVESRVNTTGRLASAIAAAADPPGVLVSMSAVGYYGDRGDEVLTEASQPGRDFLADLCTLWEKATAPAEAAGIRTVHLRQGIVLGPGGGALAPQLKLFKLCLGGRLGAGTQWVSWISLADAVGVILHAVSDERLAGPVNSVAPSPVTNAELTRALGRAVHRPAVVRAPAAALRLVMGELADELVLASQRVEPVRLAETGYSFVHAHLGAALAAAVGHGAA